MGQKDMLEEGQKSALIPILLLLSLGRRSADGLFSQNRRMVGFGRDSGTLETIKSNLSAKAGSPKVNHTGIEEKTEGRPSQGWVSEGWGQSSFNGAQQQDERLRAQTVTWEIPSKHEEKLYIESCKALVQAAQTDRGFFFSGVIQNLLGRIDVQSALGNPALVKVRD